MTSQVRGKALAYALSSSGDPSGSFKSQLKFGEGVALQRVKPIVRRACEPHQLGCTPSYSLC